MIEILIAYLTNIGRYILVEILLHACNTTDYYFLVIIGRFIVFSTLRKVMWGHMKKYQLLCVAGAIGAHSDPFRIGIQKMQKVLFAFEQPTAMRSGAWPQCQAYSLLLNFLYALDLDLAF